MVYPMSARKAAVMSALTMSAYDIVFWYRHWKRIKESGQDVNPIARTIFASITVFSLLTLLTSLRFARGIESGSRLRVTPFVYFGTTFASIVGGKLLTGIPGLVLTVLACAATAWVLFTIQRGANEVLAADKYQGPSNSGAGFATFAAGALGLVAWLGIILEAVSPESLE